MKPLSRRARLERAIEKAIALLDTIDGDPDLEPSLGYQPYVHRDGRVECVDLECDESGSNPLPEQVIREVRS